MSEVGEKGIHDIGLKLQEVITKLNTLFPDGSVPCQGNDVRITTLEVWNNRLIGGGLTLAVAMLIHYFRGSI